MVNSQLSVNMKYHKIVLLILLIITALPILMTNTIHYVLIIISFSSIFILLKKSKIQINYFIIWMLVVGIIIVFSTTWALESEWTIGQSKDYLINLSIFVYLSLLIRTEKDIYSALQLFVVSRIIMLIYILTVIDFSTLGVMRIGAGSLGEEWNANGIGLNLSLAAFATFVLLREAVSKKAKPIYLLILLSFFSFTLLTGSRKALFVLVFSILLYVLMLSGKKLLMNLFISFFLFIVLLYLLFNNPYLYEVIGMRLEGLLGGLTNNSVVDGSTETRRIMISAGIQFFKEQPVLGYGMNNYRVLLGQLIGDYRYSHNNYIELLVGIGIVGTLIYYSIFYFILKNSLRRINNLSVFAIVTVLTLLIIDYGLVSYNSYYVNFFICVAFSSMYLSTKDKANDAVDLSVVKKQVTNSQGEDYVKSY